jgi:hypothetical protein
MDRKFPELSDAALHGLPGDIVRAILPDSEADPAALLVQTLVFFGNCIGRTAYFAAEDDKHFSNLFAVLVGDTSKARKGTSLGRIIRIFRDVDKAWLTNRKVNGLSSGEGLIFAVSDGDGLNIKFEDQDDPNSEKRLLVIESEFSSVLRVMARDGNTLSARIREAWDTGTLGVMTKDSPLRATDAHISIIGHITREELRRRLNETERANGFANRFLWVATRRSKLLPEGGKLADDICAQLAERLREAVEFAHAVGEMRRDEEARDLWAGIYGELSTGRGGLAGAVTSRGEAQVMRLACVYALLDRRSVIRRVHLEAAYALWQYCEASAQYIFGDASGDGLADEILVALKNASTGLTQTELNKLFSGHKTSDAINSALASLQARGLVVSFDDQTGGRSVRRWLLVNEEKAEKARKAEASAA